MQDMTLKESSNDRPTPGTLVWRANKQSHTHTNTKRLQQTPAYVCIERQTERMPKYGLLKKLFASFQQLEWKNSDRNQSSILVILTYAKFTCTQDSFQHEIKLSSSFTSSLGSCRLLMIVSLLISKSSSKLWQKRQYVSTFLLVNNVSSFYQTISSLAMDLSQKIYKEFVVHENPVSVAGETFYK